MNIFLLVAIIKEKYSRF